MAATDRTTIIRGPGAVIYDSVTLHDADGIAAELRWAAARYGSSSLANLNTVSPGLA